MEKTVQMSGFISYAQGVMPRHNTVGKIMLKCVESRAS